MLGSYSHSKEGANVTFQCSDGFEPSTVMTATCTDIGVWNPLPEEHNCTLVEGNTVQGGRKMILGWGGGGGNLSPKSVKSGGGTSTQCHPASYPPAVGSSIP